jgi:Tol biopolymer transport system component/DNA-binding winged helix-turn-helix (wHTH) protein
MEAPSQSGRVVRFGTFELDLAAGELRKGGRKVRVQEQPFQLLAALVEKPGEVVTREDLKDKLWPGDTYVDFDRSLNTAASKLREALGDSASSPRFIETLPRRGYRFLASVESVGETAPVGQESSGVATDSPGDGGGSASHKLEQQNRLLLIGFVAAVTISLVAIGLSVFQRLDQSPARDAMPLRKLSFTPPQKLVRRWSAFQLAVSPNGRHVAFVAGNAPTLWIRDLANEQAREIPGTENAYFPFWSPDSESIGFGTDNELKKVSVEGSAAITICELPSANYLGGSWSPDGDSIIFVSDRPGKVYEVPARGGSPQVLFKQEASEEGPRAFYPGFLPSEAAARGVVFTEGVFPDTDIAVKNLETGEQHVLGTGAYPRYSRTGHIVYQTNARESGLWALPFSIRSLQPTGEAFPIAQNAGFPSIADDDTLVYADFGVGERQLVWMDRNGGKLGAVGRPQDQISRMAVSPDGTRVAVTAVTQGIERDIWVHEVERAVTTRITFSTGASAASMSPHWSPSGSELLFGSRREGSESFDLYVKSADGTGEARRVYGSEHVNWASQWSTDGKYMLADQGRDVLLLERKDGGRFEASPLFASQFTEKAAKLSPHGRYVAYVSDESGVFEVYVQRFPEGGAKRQISASGGTQPRWSRDGTELFFVDDDALMVVQVEQGEKLSVSAPEHLFRATGLVGTEHPHYDVSSDGRRFILAEDVDPTPTRIHVVQNWFAEFRDRPKGDE